MVRGMALTARMVTIDCADPAARSTFWTERVPEPKQGAAHKEGGFAWTVLADPDGNEFSAAERD
jgi:hypothetical protein